MERIQGIHEASNFVIVDRLDITAGTVKNHIQNLLEKTGFTTRTELVSEERSLGIVIKDKKTIQK